MAEPGNLELDNLVSLVIENQTQTKPSDVTLGYQGEALVYYIDTLRGLKKIGFFRLNHFPGCCVLL